MSRHSASPNEGLFQPDVILPQQFFATLRRQAPTKKGEYHLLIAVLEDAIHCFQKYVLAKDSHGQRLFREAHEWMLGDSQPTSSADEGPTLSFEYVCEVLGFDPAYVRRGLLRWRDRRLAGVGPQLAAGGKTRAAVPAAEQDAA